MIREHEASYLPNELLVDLAFPLRAIEGLLQKGEQDGDNDDCLQSLAEDNQEYRHSKDIDRHDEELIQENGQWQQRRLGCW